MTDAKTEQVNIPLDPDTKSEWQEYVDEHPDYRYMSHLARGAVGNVIRGDSSESSALGNSEGRLSDIEGMIIDLENTLSEVNNRLSNIEKALEAPEDDVLDLAGKVYEVLPEEKELKGDTHDPLNPEEVPSVLEGGSDTCVQTGRIAHISEYLEEERYRVRQAIEHLQEDTHLIKSLVMDGETRFYKEV